MSNQLCARDQIMIVLEHFPDKSRGKGILRKLQSGDAIHEYEMDFLVHLCRGMGLNVFTVNVLKHSSGYFVPSDCKHHKLLTSMYKKGHIYSPLPGLVTLGMITFRDTATHLFDEDLLLKHHECA